MSKTSQRRRSMYQQGYNDYKHYGFRWTKHPMLAVYKKGFAAAREDALRKRAKLSGIRASCVILDDCQ